MLQSSLRWNQAWGMIGYWLPMATTCWHLFLSSKVCYKGTVMLQQRDLWKAGNMVDRDMLWVVLRIRRVLEAELHWLNRGNVCCPKGLQSVSHHTWCCLSCCDPHIAPICGTNMWHQYAMQAAAVFDSCALYTSSGNHLGVRIKFTELHWTFISTI